MYMKPAEGAEEGISSSTQSLALAVAAIAIVVMGIGADPFVKLAQAANILL
jgi:NADH:ubiquinone oxidoreductase subunit 2 (subunit N)